MIERLFEEVINNGNLDVADELFAEGDRVAWLVHTSGTHTGDSLGFPATGKKFETVSANIARFRGDQAIEHWAEQGMISMLGQLGVLPMG